MSTAIGEADTAVTESATSDAADIAVLITKTKKMLERHHCLVICLLVSLIIEIPVFSRVWNGSRIQTRKSNFSNA
jgi:hypothetical protein